MNGVLPDVPRGKYVRRYAVFLVGMFIMAIGIALTSRAHLGTSPISAPPFVLSLAPGSLSFGTWTVLMHCCFVLIQIALLRRQYQWIQLLQVLVGVMFGAMIDVAMWLTSWADPQAYWLQWVQLFAGAVVLALGVTLQFVPRVLMNAGEGTVAALSQVTGVPIGRMKVLFDSTLVLIGVVLSLILFGELRGVREGTIVLALLVGVIVGALMPYSVRAMRRILGTQPR